MSEIVFILGAGASRDAGAPTMREFLHVAEKIERAHRHHGIESDIGFLLDSLGELQVIFAKSSLDLENIEAIYGTIEMARLIRKFPGLPDEAIDRLSTAIKRTIIVTLERNVRFHCSGGQMHPAPSYLEFAKLIFELNRNRQKHRASVITFNYDIALDYALFFAGIPADYCFGDGIGCTRFLKLHGSLNWAHCLECNKITPWHMSHRFRADRVYSCPKEGDISLPMGSDITSTQLTCCGAPRIDPMPVLVPPTWNKTEYHASLQVVWKQAATELSEAERIYVCGYSMPESDMFFRYLYSLGSASRTRLRQFTVFDPDETGNVERHYQDLVGGGVRSQFRYTRLKFTEMINGLRKELDVHETVELDLDGFFRSP